jgi:tetratricopeptide (TPR) repeat protein
MAGSAPNVLLLGAFLLIASVPSFADKAPVTLEAAAALEKDNKTDQAMAVYEEWLKSHTDDPQFPAVLRRCGELKKNPYSTLELYRGNVGNLKDPGQRTVFYREIAQLYTLLGDYRAALEYFERAYERLDGARGDDPWLATVPCLYIACGENDKAYEWVVRVDPAVREPSLRAELNYALLEIYLARRQVPYAEKALTVLESEFKSTSAFPKALFRCGLFWYAQNDKDKARAYHERLTREFPGSLEARAAAALWSDRGAGNISLLADPHDLLGAEGFIADAVKKTVPDIKPQPNDNTRQPDEIKNDAAADQSKQGKTPAGQMRVQVGSYTMRENAVYIAKDLEKLKFQAEIVETVIKGKTYFRVFVGKALSADEAQTVLARLQDAGIGGYLFAGDN